MSSHSEIRRSSSGERIPAWMAAPLPLANSASEVLESGPLASPASRNGPTERVVGLPLASGGPGMLWGNSRSTYETSSFGSELEAVFVRSRLPAGCAGAPAAFVGLWQPPCVQVWSAVTLPEEVTFRGSSQIGWICSG